MAPKLLGDGLRKLVKAPLVVLLDEGTQQIHIVVQPELSDGLLVSPGMLFEPCLPQEVLLRNHQLLLHLIKVNMQAELPADLETDSGRRWRWAQQGKSGIKEDGANGLRLFQWHDYCLSPICFAVRPRSCQSNMRSPHMSTCIFPFQAAA